MYYVETITGTFLRCEPYTSPCKVQCKYTMAKSSPTDNWAEKDAKTCL